MTRYLLPVLATILLGGCCTGMVCEPEIRMIESQLDGSRKAAGDLWEVEQTRAGETPTVEATVDTLQVPDGLASYSRPTWR